MLKDKDIREPLFDFLDETFGKIRIIEEKRIGRSRADVLMVMEGALAGIEIKSDADTYERLERQVKDYNRFFDYNILVAGSRHGAHAAEHIPDYWGIITVEETENGVDFYIFREMKANPKREKTVKLRNQLSFLWRPELAELQEKNHMPRYPQRSKDFVVRKIMDTVPPEELKGQICTALFERDYTTIEERIKEYKEEKRSGRRSADPASAK